MNPDASMDDIDIEDYMDLGPLKASDVARQITESPTVNAMGYCIGGTLLTLTLATLAAKGDERFNSASFMVSMQDYARVTSSGRSLALPDRYANNYKPARRACHGPTLQPVGDTRYVRVL